MKESLIDTLFNEFEKDKETIKNNLMLVLDTIILETKNEYESLTLTINYKKKGE